MVNSRETRMPERIRRLVLVGAVLLCAGLSACTTTTTGRMRTSEAVQHPMLTGIPLPKGFSPVDEKTFATESGQTRLAHYEFTGSARRDAVHEFFINHMPGAGFTLVQRQDEAGVYDLRFESSAEECLIRIGNQRFNTYFRIDLRPLPQGSLRSDDQLPPPRNP